VAATKGSVPRQAGSKMMAYPDGTISGTIGGGKFESLVLADALALPRKSTPLLKTYPLHEAAADSFGAICGGEVTVLIEPQLPPPALTLVGAGHCSRALARLARTWGWQVTVVDDRPGQITAFPAHDILTVPAPVYIAGRSWQEDEGMVLLCRIFQIE
jgi:xanthine dehydrogenase accessory factor